MKGVRVRVRVRGLAEFHHREQAVELQPVSVVPLQRPVQPNGLHPGARDRDQAGEVGAAVQRGGAVEVGQDPVLRREGV